MQCRICSSDNITMFLSLGIHPHCNNFLKKEQLYHETLYPLDVYYCNNCSLVQIEYTIPKEVMFLNYPYVSGTTRTLREHFKKSANRIAQRFPLNKEDLVVDIGSNDGTWLKYFKQFGVKTLGVEPASNIVRIAVKNGIETVNDFFSKDVAPKIINERGHASVITAAGVFFHLEDLHSVVDVLSLPFDPEVEEVVMGEKGILSGASPGTLILDTTTGSPKAAVAVAAATAESHQQ